jgi:hypothetical protein
MSLQDTLDEIKKRKIAQMITNARQNRLAVKIRNIESLYETESGRRAANIELSLKVWDVLSGLFDIAVSGAAIGTAWSAATVSSEALEAIEYAKAAQFLAGGSSSIMETMTLAEIMELAGPLMAWVAMWCALGSPYLGIEENIQKEAAKRGIAQGILIACQRRTGHSARMFALRQPNGAVNNNWINNATSVAQNSYRMGFLAGYPQGRELSEKARHIFWRIFGQSLKERYITLWDPKWGEKANDDWIWEASGVFIAKHLKEN